MAKENRQEELTRLLDERILVLDGAMGTMIQSYKLTEETLSTEPQQNRS